ncbi:b(0,+)-type amino acid transporter 1-like isoform X2 [Rhodnius prolixus]
MLKREIGLISAVGLIVSVMIGSGIFVSPSSVLEKSGSVGLCLIVWAVCGLISYMGALAFAELGTVVAKSGAEYAFFQAAFTPLHRFFGPLPSFTYIWVIVLLVRPAEVAILVLTFAEYVYNPFADYFNNHYSENVEFIIKKLISLLAIGLITFINFSSVKLYVKIQNMFSTLKIAACFIVILGGFYYLVTGHTKYIKTGFEGTKSNAKDLVLAFFSGLWSFDGWTSVTVVSEEIKRPDKNIPRSISIGVPLVTLLYFMMNVAYMTVLSVHDIIRAPAVGMRFAEVAFGPLSFMIPLAVALSTFGCGMSVQFGVSRLCYAAGRSGHMIESLSYIHIKKLTPAPAVVLQGLLTTIFILVGSIIRLIEFVSFLIWIFYGLAMVALIIMRKTKKEAPRPYKVPLCIPIFICFISGLLASIPLVMSPSIEYLGAMGFIVVGFIVYYVFIFRRFHPRCMTKVTHYIQVLLQVVPSEG